jgi:hypothetical protein
VNYKIKKYIINTYTGKNKKIEIFIKTNRVYNYNAKMRMKIYFGELEFGGLGDPYIEVLGCLRHPLATIPQVVATYIIYQYLLQINI